NYSSTPATHGSLNDALVQDYYGTSSYHSFNQKYYILFLEALGFIRKGVENDTRWAQGLRGRPVLESIASVKYFLVKNFDGQEVRYLESGNDPVLKLAFDSITQFGNVKVLQHKYSLPLGFMYDQYLTRSEFDKLSRTQKDFILLKTFFIADNEKETYP